MAEHDIAAIVAQADLPAIASHSTSVVQQGSEYKAKCVFHSPDNNPSLTFFQKGGKWMFKCFSCGEGGDALDWIEKLEGLETGEALKRLNGGTVWEPRYNKPAKKQAKLADRITTKPPAGTPAPAFSLREIGEPVRTFTIRDLDGSVIAYECRYQVGERKEVRIWSWGARGDEAPRWAPNHPSVPRPLYGLERLTEKPQAPVLITEGPKKADAGAMLLPQYASISWTGGANAWHKHNWQPLEKRTVLIWPDADEPGIEAADKLMRMLADSEGLACKVKIIDPAGQPEGWDIADALEEGWTTDQVIAWAKPKAREYEPEQASPPEPPLPPVEVYQDDAGGHDDDDGEEAAPMSEDMLAGRFADQHGENWRYVKQWNSWFEWRKDGWYKDDTAKIDRLAVELTRKAIYWPQAGQLTPAAKRLVNSKRSAGAVRDLSMSDRRIAATVDQWDTDTMLLGVPGGVVDLRTADHRLALPSDYMTKRTACAPQAGNPSLWIDFLLRVTDGDEELIAYLQRFAGYALTGETSEHSLGFLYGTGANGKTTFLQTLSGIFGDYAVSAGFEVFAESKNDRHPTEIARLRGARLVVTEETDAGGRWNEGRVKRLTGGGKISAHFMRQDDFEFEPQFKLLIAGNHKPVIKAVDEAIKRRIHLVPFTVTIPQKERDRELTRKLEREWPQILAWAIEGCTAWHRTGLAPTSRILEATEQYVEAEDVLGAWIDECCERGGGPTDGRALFDSYRKWCEEQGESAWSRKGWSSAMLDRGFEQKRTKHARMFSGIALKLKDAPDPGYEV